MADLLLELFSEEIPARMQAAAARDLERLVVGALSDRGLLFEGVKAFAGPRRLTLAITGLPAKQPDVSEEIKGPKVDAPAAALEGFLRKSGLTKEQLKVEKTPKGDVYLAVIACKGRETAEVLAEVLPETFAKLPWPKSMRFPGSPIRWVRPLHGIVCTFDGEVVEFEFAGVKSGTTTMGHRFLSSGPITVRRFDDYIAKLRDAHVVLDAAERKEIITHDLKQKAFALGLDPIADDGLLDEVAGLAEWPVVLIGTIEDQFMDVPPEILQTSMRTHQKYFSLRDPATGKMAARFAVVSNMAATDGGKEIVAGNERVLRARLSDAKFFWDQDRKRTLESRVDDLAGIVFQESLGTQYDRVKRLEILGEEIATKVGADPIRTKRAALLAKADLTSGVVGEFPELQGLMGRYYALHDDESPEVADAVFDHYKPKGQSDGIASKPISVAVSLADKFDSLAGFFALGLKPTGSSDPYALRRLALGAIRTILDNRLRLRLHRIIGAAHSQQGVEHTPPSWAKQKQDMTTSDFSTDNITKISPLRPVNDVTADVMSFLSDRLKVALREKGTRHDLIDAVFSLGNEDDLVRLVDRVEALQSFLGTEEGGNLLAGYKRAANILKAEEKKEGESFGTLPFVAPHAPPEERELANTLEQSERKIAALVAEEKFVEAMELMARLRAPVDAFFDKVKVNADDAEDRKNRLLLLSRLRATLHQVADFSKIEG